MYPSNIKPTEVKVKVPLNRLEGPEVGVEV
jgi:hypothetical protein